LFHLHEVDLFQDFPLDDGLDQSVAQPHRFDTVAHQLEHRWHVVARFFLFESRVLFILLFLVLFHLLFVICLLLGDFKGF